MNPGIKSVLARMSIADLLALYRAGGPYTGLSNYPPVIWELMSRVSFDAPMWANAKAYDYTLSPQVLKALQKLADRGE